MTRSISPIVDRDGVMIEDARGVPLAADEAGLVYTLQNDQPALLGQLAETQDGHLVIARVEGLGAMDPTDKGEALARLGRQRAHARGKLANTERRIERLRTEGLTDTHARVKKALGRRDHWTAEVARIQAEIERINGEPLSGLSLGEVADLGSFKKWWNKNKKIVGGVAAGVVGGTILGAGVSKLMSKAPAVGQTLTKMLPTGGEDGGEAAPAAAPAPVASPATRTYPTALRAPGAYKAAPVRAGGGGGMLGGMKPTTLLLMAIPVVGLLGFLAMKKR